MSDWVRPTQDQFLRVLQWLRDEIYAHPLPDGTIAPGLVGTPLDDRGIAAWLCDRYPHLRQQREHEDAMHALYREIAAVVHPPEAPKGRESRGPVRIVGRALVDDLGAWPFLSTTQFLAALFFSDYPERFGADAQHSAAHGVDVWRALVGVDWPGSDRDMDPRKPANLERFIEMARALWRDYRIRTQATIFGGTREWGFEKQEVRRAHVRWVCKAFQNAGLPGGALAWVDLVNEPSHPVIGPVSFEHLVELGRIARAELGPTAVIALGSPWEDGQGINSWTESPEGEEAYKRFMRAPANLTTPHLDRGWYGDQERWGRNARQPYTAARMHGTTSGVACGDDEPAGWGATAQNGIDKELVLPGVMRAIRSAAWAGGCAYTCVHTDQGVNISGSLADRRLADAPGWLGVGSARAFLPGDVANFRVINWNQPTVRVMRDVFAATKRGPVRGHSLVDGARVVLHDFCFLAGGYEWQASKAMRLAHYVGKGWAYEPRGEVVLRSGQTVRVDEVGSDVTDHFWVGEFI